MGAQESKLAFRRGIFRLHEERDIPPDDPYWINFWMLPESAEDVFTLFSPTDIRKARDTAPENLETLLMAVCSRLFFLRHHKTFPSEDAPEAELLNCLRVLTRLIPFCFEDQRFDKRIDNFFWGVRSRAASTAEQSRPDGTDAATRPSQDPSEANEVVKTLEEGLEIQQDQPDSRATIRSMPLAIELLDTLVDLLFFSDFTVPRDQSSPNPVVFGIWETGVGCTSVMGTTKRLESNRIETLRCLLALCSRGMYIPATETRSNRFIIHLVVALPKNVVLTMLCSLLNTTMKFNITTWRALPYSSAIAPDTRQLYVTYCLQLLLVVLCYPLPEANQLYYVSAGHETRMVNQFRLYYRKLHRASDFSFMVDGMSRVMQQPLQVSTSYLPGSQKSLRFYPEMMLLFWESLQLSPRFRAFIIETDRALDFLVLLLFYAIEHKTDTTQVGLVRMCIFILQPLSADERFAKSLQKPFQGHASLPASVRIPSFNGTYADFLIINIYTLVATSKGQLVALYPALFMTLSNIAPHVKSLSVIASTKIMQLFSSVSQPSFLFANENNYRLLIYLVEFFTNIIEQNFSSNPHLIYAILRSRDKFERLQNLTLDSGIESVEQLKQERAQRNGSEAADRLSFAQTIAKDEPVALQSAGEDAFELGDADDEQLDRPVSGATTPRPSAGNIPPESLAKPSADVAVKLPTTGPPSSSDVRSARDLDAVDLMPQATHIMSEKARGKLPAGRRNQLQQSPIAERSPLERQKSDTSFKSTRSAGGNTLGGNFALPETSGDFHPQQDWFLSWFNTLELTSIQLVLDQLKDEVGRLTSETPDPRPVVRFLQKATITGLQARPPNPRTFVWSDQAKVWFESLLWGYVYVSETQLDVGAVGVWTGTRVKLFRLQAQPTDVNAPGGRPDDEDANAGTANFSAFAANARVNLLNNVPGAVDAMANSLLNKFNQLTTSTAQNTTSQGQAQTQPTARRTAVGDPDTVRQHPR
ncbi:hypothetical protein PYCC9005_002784 [Savitreella phatthalungensis]